MKTISEAEYRRLQAAEEFCRAAREGYASRGTVGRQEFAWFDRWMRLSLKSRYDSPRPVRPTWCAACRARHIAGNCPQANNRISEQASP